MAITERLSCVMLFDREGIGRGGSGNMGMGYGTYSGMSMGRAGNVHPQQVGSGASMRPGSAGSAPGATYAEPFNYVSLLRR